VAAAPRPGAMGARLSRISLRPEVWLPWLTVLGFGAYVVSWLGREVFYAAFGVSSEIVGVHYPSLLIPAAVVGVFVGVDTCSRHCLCCAVIRHDEFSTCGPMADESRGLDPSIRHCGCGDSRSYLWRRRQRRSGSATDRAMDHGCPFLGPWIWGMVQEGSASTRRAKPPSATTPTGDFAGGGSLCVSHRAARSASTSSRPAR
jgi:hypothetical protein